MSEIPSTQPEMFLNREGIPYSARALAGLLPVLGVAFALLGVALWFWVSSPTSIFFLGFLIFWIGLVVVIGIVWTSTVRSKTPTKVGVTPSGVVVEWDGAKGGRRTIPFDRVTSLAPRRWRWVHGPREGFFRFTPAALQFNDSKPGQPDHWTSRGLNQDVVYLTDANAERIRRTRLVRGDPKQETLDSVLT